MPALERGDRDRGVQEGRRRHADGVQPVDLQQVLPAVDVALDAVRAASSARGSPPARDGDGLDAGEGVVGGEVLSRPIPTPTTPTRSVSVPMHVRLAPPRRWRRRNRAPW